MNFTDPTPFFNAVLLQSLGRDCPDPTYELVTGGGINMAVWLCAGKDKYFLKWNEDEPGDMFSTEAKGLQLLRKSTEMKIPEVYGCGDYNGVGYILMEYIDGRLKEDNYWEILGYDLAAMHVHTHRNFGLDHDNFIGRLTQSNDETKSWLEFFVEQRLKKQVGLALYKGSADIILQQRFEQFYEKLTDFFPKEKPALLHGDLWSGNVIVDEKGLPALVDPAVYYGHREMELAFTELFGGFDRKFYNAYSESYPLEAGYEDRRDVYNLYPLLVHLNLFGQSYMSGIDRVLKRFGC